MTTGVKQHLRIPPPMGIAFITAGSITLLTIAVASFTGAHAAHAYDNKYYDFCTNNLQQPEEVCCANSGGQMTNGVCADPAALPAAPPTITQQVLPPVIGAPR